MLGFGSALLYERPLYRRGAPAAETKKLLGSGSPPPAYVRELGEARSHGLVMVSVCGSVCFGFPEVRIIGDDAA